MCIRDRARTVHIHAGHMGLQTARRRIKQIQMKFIDDLMQFDKGFLHRQNLLLKSATRPVLAVSIIGDGRKFGNRMIFFE